MDIWQLHIFCKVIELESFSKAGAAVHISQSTVSSHIANLEEMLGIRLIDRFSKKAIPTKAGKLLYRYAKQIVALRDEAESAIAEFQGTIKGVLEIGGSTIPGTYLLPRIIGGFKSEYSNVTISLKIGDTDKIIQSTLLGNLEMGIVGAVSNAKSLSQERLMDDEMCLVVPPNHPFSLRESVSFDMLQQELFIVRECGSGTLRSLKARLNSAGENMEELNIAAEMGSTEAIIQGIKGGLGLSILSKIAVADDVKTGMLAVLSIDGIDLKRSLYLIRNKHRSMSPLGKVFTDYLKNNIGK